MRRIFLFMALIVFLTSAMTMGCQKSVIPPDVQESPTPQNQTFNPGQESQTPQPPTPRSEPPDDHITIKGVDYSTSLTSLELSGWEFSNQDIVTLPYMTNLTTLSIVGTQISDISPLANLTGLEELILFGNSINDITPLSSLTSLKSLLIRNCRYSSHAAGAVSASTRSAPPRQHTGNSECTRSAHPAVRR